MDAGAAAEQHVWRLFAAVELPEPAHERVATVAARLSRAGWRAKWVAAEGVHVTLKFYGNVGVERLDELNLALAGAARLQRPFELEVAAPGAFPNQRRPRVLWLGLGGELAALGRLAEAVEQRSAALGFPPEERPFRPHITVARVRPEQQETITDPAARLAELASLPPIPFRVDHFALFRSQLRREGPIYTVIQRFELG